VPNTLIRLAVVLVAIGAIGLSGAPAMADADQSANSGADVTALGLQPLASPIPAATPSASESRLTRREDGTSGAIGAVAGTTRTFHLTEREAPWTLRPGLTVRAKTYNGVVPGPTLVAHQGETVEIDLVNALGVADIIHLHGIHGGPVSMDGVPGISQPMVPPGGHFLYRFKAEQPGTFIYHSHSNEEMVNSGLYGALVVLPAHPRPEERVARDDVEMLSSWKIQSDQENHFTINGKEYPATAPIEVRKGERVRLRWINMSGENFHTMHTHGHDQLVIARDAQPLAVRDLEDTVLLGPGQRVDVVITADAQPGTWMVHCHVLDHIEDAMKMPAGLITVIHYAGTPNTALAMQRAMSAEMSTSAPGKQPLSFGMTAMLGAFAGLTIFLGLPIARARRLSSTVIGSLNALAIGILVYLIVEIAQNATSPLILALTSWWHGGTAFCGSPQQPCVLIAAYVAGLLLGLIGLGTLATRLAKRGTSSGGISDHPILLAMIIAIGIGAHNFAEGLAIGASAGAGATAIALTLIIGFALHNATEGFGIAAPLAGRGQVATWSQIGLAGLIAGGPTFIGTIIGYHFSSLALQTFFLTAAVGALIFVVGELWSVLKRNGLTVVATSMLAAGFVIALATEIVLEFSGA